MNERFLLPYTHTCGDELHRLFRFVVNRRRVHPSPVLPPRRNEVPPHALPICIEEGEGGDRLENMPCSMPMHEPGSTTVLPPLKLSRDTGIS